MFTLHWHLTSGQWTTLFGSAQTGHETSLKQILFTIFLATPHYMAVCEMGMRLF